MSIHSNGKAMAAPLQFALRNPGPEDRRSGVENAGVQALAAKYICEIESILLFEIPDRLKPRHQRILSIQMSSSMICSQQVQMISSAGPVIVPSNSYPAIFFCNRKCSARHRAKSHCMNAPNRIEADAATPNKENVINSPKATIDPRTKITMQPANCVTDRCKHERRKR